MGDALDAHLDAMLDQDPDWDDDPNPPAFKTCRCCGTDGLEWGLHQGKWRLFKRGELHVCPVNPLKQPAAPKPITDPIERAFRAGYDAGYVAADKRAYPPVGPGYIERSVEEEWADYRP